MAIAEISYSDKSDINTTATPEVNKITASNLNEIKSVVNTNANSMGDLSNLTTSETGNLVGAINELASSQPVIVRQVSFNISDSGTGWKMGNFSYSTITGYTLVAVATRNVPSSDANFFMFNIASSTTIYYGAYIGYANYGTVNVNLIYVKTDYVS